jgi:autotransporter-associated beta strand protein
VVNAGTLVTGGNETLADSGSVTVNSGGTFKLGGNETIASLSGTGTADVGANSLTLSSGNFSGALAGSGDLYKTGANAFTLSGTSAGFTGDLYLQGGSVVAGSSTALNANNFVLLSAGSTFTANQNLVLGGIDQNGGTIDGTGVITAVSTITRSGSINSVLGDVVGYNSGVMKLGTGTTTLGAVNTYSGTTKVSEGTLALGGEGSLATNSSAQINSGATLDLAAKNQSLKDVKVNGSVAGSGSLTVTGTLSGSGTINPDTVVAGTHSPGNSPGIQSFGGSLTYQPGATMLWQLADNTTSNSPLAYDQVIVGGNLNFNGGTTLVLSFNDVGSLVNWTDSLWTTDQSWTIYQVSGSATGLSNLNIASYSSLLDAYGNEFGTTLAGASFSITQNGNNIVLNYAVPEPSTYALFGLGALALVIAYRRKSQQAGS